VAAALLKDPELLVLDEPANGLDPKGMADMRAIIRKIRGEGKTVLLSSHLLGEVEQICDRIGVILQGKLVVERTMEELRGQEGGLLVRAEPLEEAKRVVKNLPRIEDVQVVDEMLQLTVDPAHAAEINAGLVNAGMRVSELRPVERSLEEMFLELTGGETV
jgi:ABC-2 type transport system ATP-binding protein